VIAVAALCAALCALAIGAGSAFANRTLATTMAGGTSMAFDANENVWLTDGGRGDKPPGQAGLYKYDPYPSQTLLAEPNTYVPWQYYILDLQDAVDQSTNEVFVTQANGDTVDIFSGEDGHYLTEWNAINGAPLGFGLIHVGIDNSNTASRGRVYLSLTSPENDVEIFNAAQQPVDFPATASYIHNNVLTGTPAHHFGEVGHVAVGSNGNLFVTDVFYQVIDEFDSSGTFLRALPCSGCSGGYPVGSGAAAEDPNNGNIVVGDGSNLNEYDSSGNLLERIPDGGAPAINPHGYLYSSSGSIYTPNKVIAKANYKPVTLPTTSSGTLNAMVDPNGGGDVTECRFEYAEQGALNTTDTNAVQTLTISGATGGKFTLGFNGQTTSATGTGNLSAATGEGDLSSGSKEVTSLATKSGVFAVGEEISGHGIPSSTTIAKIGSGTLELSQPATEYVTGAELAAGSKEVTSLATKSGVFAVGEVITGSGIPSGTTIAKIGSGTLELSQPATETVTATGLTAGTMLSYEAEASSVQSALEGLSTIGSGNVAVTGSPGGPFKVEFIGRLAGAAMPLLTADSSALSPPSATASIKTTTMGGHWAGTTEIPCLNEANEEVDTHPIPNASPATEVHGAISGLSAETTYEYRVVALSANGTKYGADQTYTTGKVPGLSTDPATNLSSSSATLNASFVGDGSHAHYYFEWGPTTAYGNETATPPGTDAGSPSGPSRTAISTELTGLSPYSTYHFRVVATNGSGTTVGEDQFFTTTPGSPSGQDAAVTAVHSDRALLHGEVNPNGADTMVHFEYVDDEAFQQSGWTNAKVTSPNIDIGMSKHFQSPSQYVDGLIPGTVYHYRVVGENSMGSGTASATFTTFAFTPSFVDPCPNAHVRQQTGASLLLDCRAYELVSASEAGGYDVESNLVPGQMPFGDYPNAENPPQVLYGVHNGGIPGSGYPTNNGVDPYVATRTNSGWTTKYVGIPANNPYASGPFSSTLAEADAGLSTFAFGGPAICSPCFQDGSTGNPIHLPNGELVQGMAGSIPQTAAKPAGFIGKSLSADGTRFVFGSTSKFEPDAEEGTISIYDRNLDSEETHVVSKLPSGANIPCLTNCSTDGIGELDISNDGSRILVGQLVSEEGGSRYWHLFMNTGDSTKTIDLAPSATNGLLYDGMTNDGSKVFFSSEEHLTNEDTSHSGADIFMWSEAGEKEGKPLTLISTGKEGAGNSNSCNPFANTVNVHWNTTGPAANCGDVAVGGGGGVASGDGTIYFLSPELLDGVANGVGGAPNLYVARPGQPPHFIRTLESNANAPLPSSAHPYLHSFGSFSNAAGTAIDHATGDVYAFDIHQDIGPGDIYKFDSAGHTVTSFGASGRLSVPGAIGFYEIPVGIAVDNSSGPNHGDLYVPDCEYGIVKQYSPQGVHIADINVGDRVTGVAVDPANGNVYVTGYYSSQVFVYDTNGNPVTTFPTISNPLDVAVDSSGNAYVVNGGGESGAKGITEKYSSIGKDLGQLDGNPSYAVAVDPSNNHVYVDEGNQVSEFDSAGNPVGTPTSETSQGPISNSHGVAADSGNLAIGDRGHANVAYYGPSVTPSDPSTDNPVVVDSVDAAGTRNTADFQVSPSGNDAVFTSTLPLTGYDNAAHREVFRYDAPTDTLDCASCNSTSEQATGEATLASNGLSLTDDGQVFFNSTEGLVDRDLNGNKDVYEWEKNASYPNGTVQLISTGTSPLDSSLLGVSADGTDAYFFTHDTLVTSDNNGDRVKLYDARVNGGFDQAPPPHQCQASDECHGPSSQAPPPPNIKATAGTPVGNTTQTQAPIRCKKGFVKRQGKCVRKRHHRKAPRHG